MRGKRDANISGKVILEEAESQGFADSFTEFSVHGNCRVVERPEHAGTAWES